MSEKECSDVKQNAVSTDKRTKAQILSQAFSSSLTNACITMQQINPSTDVTELMNTYERKTDIMLTGDTRRIETMLMAQAFTLESLFHDMARIAVNASHLPMKQVCMDMALKAQKQCRQTLSALVDIKHPQTATFVKQQNNAINQQVNTITETGNSEKNSANELLREVEHASVDRSGTIETVFTYPEMETVGKIDRSEN